MFCSVAQWMGKRRHAKRIVDCSRDKCLIRILAAHCNNQPLRRKRATANSGHCSTLQYRRCSTKGAGKHKRCKTKPASISAAALITTPSTDVGARVYQSVSLKQGRRAHTRLEDISFAKLCRSPCGLAAPFACLLETSLLCWCGDA